MYFLSIAEMWGRWFLNCRYSSTNFKDGIRNFMYRQVKSLTLEERFRVGNFRDDEVVMWETLVKINVGTCRLVGRSVCS